MFFKTRKLCFLNDSSFSFVVLGGNGGKEKEKYGFVPIRLCRQGF